MSTEEITLDEQEEKPDGEHQRGVKQPVLHMRFEITMCGGDIPRQVLSRIALLGARLHETFKDGEEGGEDC